MSGINDTTILPPSNVGLSSGQGHRETPILPGTTRIGSSQIIYKSKSMNDLMSLVDRVAPSTASVLILGESGTGSERRQKPFVVINCGALRETLLESELFGHEKGSFTGAYNKKIGLAEVADGGTLFLDEIGELSQAIQAKLLRFLQEGEFFRVGGKERINVNVRVISATNRELEDDVKKGIFREDLFYRINTIIAHTPALRRRKDDIPGLIEHFLSNGANRYLKRGVNMSDEAMAVLLKYDWPGNIRELQNLCDRLQILCEGHTITVGDLPKHIISPDPEKVIMDEYDPAVTLQELERRYIIRALNHFDGNKTKAANALGITIKTLYNKLHEYGEFDKYAIHTKV
jgi:transcriptional regulator with PAS, ATPase and Fis domain